jgi:hypothetical protein
MANRKLIVEVVGDSSSLERTFARSTRSTKQLETGVTGSLSRVDKAFSRTQRIAAGGFIGGAAVAAGVTALKSLISAAQDSENTLGQTRVALESTGKSWQDYGKQIESAVAAQSRLGFDDEALLRSFSLFVRQSKDVGQALRENNIAMDVARARFISLEEATNIVNKAALGQAGALRRIGIDARAGASGVELLAQLEREFGGAAEDASKRSSASMDRASVAVENLQEQLGNALLPAVADVAEALANGAEDATFFAQELGKLGSIKIPAIHIPFVFDTPGGTVGGALGRVGGDIVKTAVKLQFFGIGLTAASILKDQLSDGMDAGTRASTPDLAAEFESSLNGMFNSALNTASAKVKPEKLAPAADFGKLPGVDFNFADTIVGAIDKATAVAKKQVGDALRKGNAAVAKEAQEAAAASAQAAAEKAAQARRDAFARILGGLELGVDRATLTRQLSDDLAALSALRDGLQRQVKAGVDVSAAQSQLVSVTAQIASKQAEIRRNAADALQAGQFKALGLDKAGGQVTPGIENLKKQLSQLSSRLGADATPKLAGQLDRIGDVLSGKFGKVTEQTRAKIKELFDGIRDELGKGMDSISKAVPTPRHVQLSDKILEALGFDKNLKVPELQSLGQTRSNRARATAVPVTTGTSGGVTISGNITVVADDPDAFLRELQKKAGRTTATARGRFPGRSLGLG